MIASDIERLTTIQVADVYKAGRLAASLRRVESGIEFTYAADYLASVGRQIATTLPLTDVPVHTHAGAVPPFFAGLLPEGRRLSGLRRAVKTSADDELSLLLAVGSDVIGDVQIVPAGAEPTPAEPVLRVVKDWSEVRFANVLTEAGVVDPVGLPGVQDKVSARMISVPVARAGQRFLLKVDPPEFPHVVENEAFFLELAKKARMVATEASVVRDADGRLGLLVRRFDRLAQPSGSTLAVACEDACQVLGRWPADKYNLTSEQVVRGLADQCAARGVALRSLFQQLCFGWLTGNGDIHAKNLSILSTPDGEWRISPAYDLPSTAPYADKGLALPLGGRTRGISRNHLLAFASTIDLPQRVAVSVLDDLLVKLEGLEQLIRDGALPFERNVTMDVIRELRFRRTQALG